MHIGYDDIFIKKNAAVTRLHFATDHYGDKDIAVVQRKRTSCYNITMQFKWWNHVATVRRITFIYYYLTSDVSSPLDCYTTSACTDGSHRSADPHFRPHAAPLDRTGGRRATDNLWSGQSPFRTSKSSPEVSGFSFGFRWWGHSLDALKSSIYHVSITVLVEVDAVILVEVDAVMLVEVDAVVLVEVDAE